MIEKSAKKISTPNEVFMPQIMIEKAKINYNDDLSKQVYENFS